MFKKMFSYLEAAKKNDPAARNKFYIFFLYPGFHALMWHQVAHFFDKIKLKFLARWISQFSRHRTGIEIHPAVKIGYGVFIDHGMGVVIGETAEIGNNVTIYQNVTLGGTGKERGKRHPTIRDNVIIYAGAKILGAITIESGCIIGAQSVVLKDVPKNSTVVGVPGKIIKTAGEKVNLSTDVVGDKVIKLEKEIEALKREIKLLKK